MAKHNWPELRRRYLSGEWLTLEAMSETVGIRANYLRARAATEKWSERRATLEREGEAKAMERITTRLAREAEKRIPGWLDMADALKFKALQSLTSNTVLSGFEAIRAAQAAVNIEADIFMPNRRRPAAEGDAQGLSATQININMGAQGQPARLPAPAALVTLTDAQLESIYADKAAKFVGARVVDAKAGSKPKRRRGRKAKKAKGKAVVQKLRQVHIQNLPRKLAP